MTNTQTKYVPEHLEKWHWAENYFGEDYSDYFVAGGQHRDSDCIGKSNFECTLEMLGGESKHVIVTRANRWAVGWIENILIHEDAPKKLLEKAEEIICILSEYPVLDDVHYYEMVEYERQNYWEFMSMNNRINALKDVNENIFKARHDKYPECLSDWMNIY